MLKDGERGWNSRGCGLVYRVDDLKGRVKLEEWSSMSASRLIVEVGQQGVQGTRGELMASVCLGSFEI